MGRPLLISANACGVSQYTTKNFPSVCSVGRAPVAGDRADIECEGRECGVEEGRHVGACPCVTGSPVPHFDITKHRELGLLIAKAPYPDD